MKITVLGRGNIGGGLGKKWEAAGHEVTLLGRDGGDASDADVVVVAVPSGSVTEALSKVTGLEGKIALDTINPFGGRNEQYESFTHEVKATTKAPVAKFFNINFARLYDEVDSQSKPPGNFYVAEDEVREIVEQLTRDAGYDPISVGGLENARLLEDQITFTMAISNSGTGLHFYRYGGPGEL
jgi:8-hydroxy-5-deazaflavin:NADPH oxidoreductase